MSIGIFIKIAIILMGILLNALAITTLIKRSRTPIFTIIWIFAGIVLIITGIFAEPYNWITIMGPSTIILIFFLGIMLQIYIKLRKGQWIISKKLHYNNYYMRKCPICTSLYNIFIRQALWFCPRFSFRFLLDFYYLYSRYLCNMLNKYRIEWT